MNITIVGAGAMGSLFGALLTESGEAVCLLDIWKEHVDIINDRGLGIELNGKTRFVKIRAEYGYNSVNESDLVIIFVKSTQTYEAAKTAHRLIGDKTFVLTLQNGMGNADAIAEIIEPERVIAGTTAHGATVIGPGYIRHAGQGPTILGMWSGRQNVALERIAEVFNTAGIVTEVVDDVKTVVWKKLIINVGINAITALTGIKNGGILDLESTRDLVGEAVKEAVSVAASQGIKLPRDMTEQVFKVAKATGANRSSMGQDIDNKRQTEIDAINGAVVDLAKKSGHEKVPVNETLTALVRTCQAHYSTPL